MIGVRAGCGKKQGWTGALWSDDKKDAPALSTGPWSAWTKKDALMLYSLLNQPADHVAQIKAPWQHPPSVRGAWATKRCLCGARFCVKCCHRRGDARNVISQQPAKCSIHLFRCHSMRRAHRRRYVTCPVRSGCQASVHNLDIEMAGNWKTDAPPRSAFPLPREVYPLRGWDSRRAQAGRDAHGREGLARE